MHRLLRSTALLARTFPWSTLAPTSVIALALLCPPLSAQATPTGGQGSAGAQAGGLGTGLPGIPAAVREALWGQDTAAALAALAAMDGEARDLPQLADTLRYLRASVLDQADRRAEALAALDELDRASPQSSWKHKSRFLRAELLRRERRFEEAAALYAEEARRLSGTPRQGELAQVYLRFAEELAGPPPSPSAKPDFVRAAALFGRVLELGAGAELEERASFRRVQCLEAAEQWPELAAASRAHLLEFDPSFEASAGSPRAEVGARRGGGAPRWVGAPAWTFAVRLSLARAQWKTGAPAEARRTLEDLSTDLRLAAAGEGPAGPAVRKLSGDALRAVLALDGEAQYALVETWSGESQARSALSRFVERFPDHARAPRARLELGEALTAAGRTDEAVAVFDGILAQRKPAAGDPLAAALQARALYVKGMALANAARHAEAREAFVSYTREFPAGADWTEAQQRMLDSEYAEGLTQREREEFDAARRTWSEYLSRHPLDPRAAQILFDIGELDAAVAQAESTPAGDRAGRWRAAVATWRELEAKYAEKDPAAAGRARLRIGGVLERELGDFQGAVAAYRSCSGTPAENDAREALRIMTEPELFLEVERAALGREPLTARIEVRNVEKVSVELWRLDLEAYFRKNLGHGNVEGLDLDLIGAQQKFEVPIAGYERFKPLEQVLELDAHGAEGPGAWVIAVSAGKLRTSALCLRTDLDLIVKSTPDETLVFAQDMARGEPAAGVRVLAALGDRQGTAAPVVLEGLTDGRGFVRFALDPRSTGGHVGVLGMREGHWASCGVDFRVEPVQELLPRAVVYTDRPAYGPGEVVHWRAVLRGAQDGRLAVQPGRKLDWRVLDARGRAVVSMSQVQSEFGTAQGEFRLPLESSLGDWTLSVSPGEQQTFSVNFTVAQFRLAHVSLDVGFEREVYFRGEEAVARIEARYSHGGPLADAPLTVRLPDGRLQNLRTSADGRARVAFSTRESAEEQVLAMEVTLAEVPLSETARAWLALREFSLLLTTERDEFAADTPFTAKVRARGPEGSTPPEKLTLELAAFRLVERSGRPRGEALVSRYDLTCDRRGVAEQSLRLEKGGKYLLRVTGQDRFGNRIVDEQEVELVGKDEPDRLRMFSEQSRLSVGAEGSVDVLENGPGGLALVTFETGRVVDWRWIKLAPGHNALSFPVPDALAPQFALQVAHQRRGTYRQARLDFEVRRELTLSVKPQSPLLAPGAACVIDVEVLDVLGKPVAAELSLAVVDEALFELYEDRSPDLAEVFRESGSSRESAVASSSSSAFSYQAATWEVSGEVLAEARRVEEELQWKSDRAETAKLLAGLPAPGSPSPGPGGPTSPGPAGASDEFFLGRGGGVGSQFGGRRGRAFGGGGGGGGTKDKSAGPEPLDRASPTAYWTATLTTDASGKASVTFPAPDVSSRWRVAVHGATRDPRAKSSTASFTTRADFFVELVAPAALAEGDRPRFFARLFNTTETPMEVQLELGLRGAGLQATLPGGKLTLAPGTQELAFGELPQAVSAGLLELSLTGRARAGGRDLAAQDRARVSVGSFGVEFSAAKSGVFSTDAEFALELPRGRKYSNLTLELFVGPDLDGLLVDEALGLHPHFCLRAPETDGTARAADLLGAAEVLGQLARTGRDSSPDHARVRERTAALASVLLAAQDEQRGWTSSWRNSEHDTELTAHAMLALAAARDAGIALAPECGPNGTAALERMQRATGSEELRALIQHALSRWDRADYGALNRLHRLRAELSNAALAHSALALSAMDRREMAGELAELLAQRAQFDAAAPDLGASWGVEKNLPGSRSPLGTAAFAVLALEACAPRSPALERGVQYLLAHRPWFDPRARGVALAALARHQGTVVPASERCEVTAAIGGAAPRKLDPTQGSLRIPVELADNGKLALRLALTGRGRPHFVAILRGFSAEGTAPRERRASAGEFQVLAPAPLWRGRAIQVGFSSVREFKDQWVNRVGSLPRGDQAWASLSFTRPDPGSDAQARDWLLVDVPFPAGARAREATIQGGIAAAEVLADRIVAYVPPDTEYFTLQFRLEGAVPGRYRVGPSVMRRLSTTEVIAVGQAREFEILPLGGKPADPYRATPDELYGLGMAAWGAGQHDEARTWLLQLMKDFQPVLADQNSSSPLQEAAGALFFLALEADDAAEIVRWFEVLREKRPDQVIPFDRILAVAQAYSTIDEHERALSILRASVGETFGVDLKVAGAMEAQGDVSSALALLARLWSEYPDAPPVLETWLALSDKLLTLAPRALEEASLVRDGRSRAGLHLEGTRLLQLFLCLYPRDPVAPEAALNLISAHLGLEDYETVSSQAAAFAARYATPDYADAFLYSRAVAEWYLGHDEEALRVCERVASAVWRDAAGVERPSKNRELAQYILAQIHHARREVERAAEYYQKVESSFADARAALAGLREKRLSMGEVTRARPGEAVRLELASKNVPEVELAIYPVDLMTLYLREADLAQVSKVELSGIAPLLTQRAALGPGNTLRESKQVLDLALPRTGAYLALARGGELFATGLILVSDLDLDVAEDAETGLVRVQVVDSRDGKYVRDVDVRVVGSEDKHIQRAKTDLRGMASLDAVQGLSTVIARSGEDRYAFYRGSKLLGSARPDRNAGELKQEAPEQLSQEGYLKNVFGFNASNQSQRAGRLNEEIDRQRLGVQINQVK